MLGLFISFPKNKNKNAPDVYETCLGNANPDTNKDRIRCNGFEKQPPIKNNSPLPPFQHSMLGFKGLLLQHTNFTAINALTFCFSPFPQLFNGKLFWHPSLPKHTHFYILPVQPMLRNTHTTAGCFSNDQFVVPMILDCCDDDTVSCAAYHDCEDAAEQLAPCTEVALAVLYGRAWELSGRVKRALTLPQHQHNPWKPVLSRSSSNTIATWNSVATSVPSLLSNTPSHQTFATFLPPHQQQYPGKDPTSPDGFAPFPECICGHTLPRRTFPCGSLHLPKRRCLVPFGTPWGAQDICTEMAYMTWDYRKPVSICISGRKPGRTPESY